MPRLGGALDSSSLKKWLLSLLAAFAGTSAAQPWQTHANPIPPRLQWNANGGYCGEVALISAGLYYGQYLSQYTARACAIGQTPQDQGELLLGVNDRRAARRMHLKSIEWKGWRQKSTAQFLRWVKRQVLRGHPVAIGVYNNEYLLYGRANPNRGDQEYDHIVPAMRIRSRHALSSDRYHSNDRLTFSDNGLWGVGTARPYDFTYSFGSFAANRQQANAMNGPLYSLPDYGRNYAIAITGVRDIAGDTLPVRVETSRNDERPNMKRHSTERPQARPLELKITVSQLAPGVDYKLYRYDRLADIPDSRFNARSVSAAKSWAIRVASGSTCMLRERIMSGDVAAYRCVKASAP